ncbi:unnamed protein product, partial [Rotaria sp. Silwood1]
MIASLYKVFFLCKAITIPPTTSTTTTSSTASTTTTMTASSSNNGSAGNCTTGYSRATNAVLGCITTQFAGKTYRSTTSNNCCIWTADTYQCYGFDTGCNANGQFSAAPTLAGGGGCYNLQQRYSLQLTFCGSS